ncbi:MAG: hypothetical protein V4594_05275 [Bacteroidota bacterium]
MKKITVTFLYLILISFVGPAAYCAAKTNNYKENKIVLNGVNFLVDPVLSTSSKYRVENSYNRPNYLFMPWDVAYKGLNLKSNSISFGQSINGLTNGVFFGKDVADKRYAIFRIADYLYRRKIAE